MFNAESLLGQVRKVGIHVLQDFAHFVQTGEEVYKVFEALKEEGCCYHWEGCSHHGEGCCYHGKGCSHHGGG